VTASPEERFEWLVTELWSSRGEQVYAVLDGAQDRSVMAAVIHSGLPHECLFAGPLSSDLREVAPYLVQLEKGGSTTRSLLNMGWGRSYGIFAASPAPLEAMRQHFRRFLRVRTEDSTRLFFRYYDPRVLRAYVPTCNDAELGVLFGPVVRYYAESEGGQGLASYHRDGTGLHTTMRQLP
jgi:hypothetical protein